MGYHVHGEYPGPGAARGADWEGGTLTVELPAELGVESPERFAMGGMAELFLAERSLPEGGRLRLVVKHMLPQYVVDAELVSRFRDEARLGLLLRHSNIVRVLEYREVGGQHYMLMEQVHGTNLSKLIKACRYQERRVPEEVVAYLMLGIASALAYMADATAPDGSPMGLVHRDISPSNVLVSDDAVIKLIDFGVAKAATRETQTKAGVMVGKYAYMSPEQIRGQGVDIRSDIFAVGAVGYELLTGRRAFLAETEFETYNQIIDGDYPPVETFRSGVDPILVFAIKRCLAVDLDERYGHPLRLVEDLRLYLHEAAALPPPILAMQFLEGLDLDPDEEGLDELALEGLTAPSQRTPDKLGPVETIGPPPPEAPPRETSAPSYPSSPTLSERPRAETAGILHGEPVAARTSVDPDEPETGSRRRSGMGWTLWLAAAAAGMALLLLLAFGTWVVAFSGLGSRDGARAGGPSPDLPARVVDTVPPVVEPPDNGSAGIVIEDAEEVEEAEEIADTEEMADTGDIAEPDPLEPIEIEDRTPERTEELSATVEAQVEPAEVATPAPAARPGTVSVFAIPWGILTVDGARMGQTPVQDLQLSPGAHTLVVTNPDSGQTATTRVTITSGAHENVRLQLVAP